MKNKETFIISEGHPVKNAKDIVKFLNYAAKKYSIKIDKGATEMLVRAYQSSPKGKDHIVVRNQGNEWFMVFLSNEDVFGMARIDKKTKVYSK